MKMQKKITSKIFATIISIAAIGFSTIARGSSVIEEVVVTAQKRSESLQSVPVAITAFSAESMESKKIEVASDIALAIPNLQMTGAWGDNQPTFTIRGMSMADYSPNQTSPVGVYSDEVNLPVNYLQSIALFDLERTEVLRGPQGTLYGKNTTGGAINFISKAPSFDEANGYIVGTLGDFSRRQVKAAYGWELVDDTLAARVAFTATKTDGHWQNNNPNARDLTDIDTWAARMSLKYENDSFDATLRYSHGESNGLTIGVVNEPRQDINGNFVGSAGAYDAIGRTLTPPTIPRDPDWSSFEGSSERDGDFNVETDSVSLNANYEMGDYTLTSVTSYSEGALDHVSDADGVFYRLLDIDFAPEIDVFSQDLRLTTDFGGAFNTILGIYYDKQETVYGVDIRFHPFGLASDANYQHELKSLAVYSHSTYDISDTVTLTAGLRYTKDEGDALMDAFLFTLDANGDPDALIANSIPNVARDYDDTEVTGKLGLDWQMNDDVLLYTSFSRGYRSSAFNAGAVFAPGEFSVVAPEFVDSYEVGFKSIWFDNRLQLNAAYFFNIYEDQQFLNVVNGLQLLENGEEAEISGFELEIMALPTEALALNIGIGYLDAEYTELSLNDPFGGPDLDLSGNELISAPDLNVNIGVDYTLLDNSTGVYSTSFNAAYTSERWFSPYNDDVATHAEVKADSHWVGNVNLSWETVDGDFGVSAWVKNLSNNDEPIYAQSLGLAFGFDYVIPPLPRRWGVDFTYNF